ncbi:glucose dehydrogenase [Apiospora phragmitis]|uniref:Glucose dehydrogenase n=1 Tax=Apiospora phragmitis TaxID=2905665 RepID=A0ABR1VHG5_9PEZI
MAVGAVYMPQLLMLSGIGPEDEFSKHSISVKKNLPDVGKNYADHILSPSAWKVPEQGWAPLGSSNSVFKSAANTLGSPPISRSRHRPQLPRHRGDDYVYREGVRQEVAVAGSAQTFLGRGNPGRRGPAPHHRIN